MLWVPDMHEAMVWYQSLGFDVVSTDEEVQAPGEIGWCMLALQGAHMMLRPGGSHDADGHGHITLSFDVEDVQALFASLPSMVEVVYPPRVQPYGRTDFEVRDRYGYRLLFGQKT